MTGDGAAEGVRRRTVLKGAAWSVPVAAVAVAVPARSASVCPDCEGYEVTQTLEKQNGAWQYRDTITVTHCGEGVPVDDLVVIVHFDNPEDYVHGTNGEGTTTSYDPATGDLTVTSTSSDDSMYFSGQIGHGNDASKTVTGNISVAIASCPGFVIQNQPFSFVTVKN